MNLFPIMSDQSLNLNGISYRTRLSLEGIDIESVGCLINDRKHSDILFKYIIQDTRDLSVLSGIIYIWFAYKNGDVDLILWNVNDIIAGNFVGRSILSLFKSANQAELRDLQVQFII